MTNNRYIFLAACSLLVVGEVQERTVRMSPTAEVRAQSEAACVRNIPTVRNARTDAFGRSALQSLASCPDTGAAVVAERWRGRPTDTSYIEMLQQVSMNINDERIADAAIDIIEDRAAPQELRRRALETIATQLSPTFYVRLGTLHSVPGRTGKVVRGFVVGTPHFYLAGRREIGPDARVRYEQRLLAVAAQDTVLESNIRLLIKMGEDARRLR